MEQRREQYIRASNSALAYIEEKLSFDPNTTDVIPKKELYRHYVEWCRSENLPSKRMAELTKTIQQNMPNIRDGSTTLPNRERARVWYSLKVEGFNPEQKTLQAEEP